MSKAPLRALLEKPFDPPTVKWRLGSTFQRDGQLRGLALAYIDARHVMDRLDEVVGPANWQSAIAETPVGRVLCTLSLRIDGEWIAKTDGAGATQVEGDKGGISDALKRAAVQWGIGRYLYAMGDTYVRVEERGKTKFIPKDEFKRLARVIELQFAGKFEEMKREIETVHSDQEPPADSKPAAAPQADETPIEDRATAMAEDWLARIKDSGTLDDLKDILSEMNKQRAVFSALGEPHVSTFASTVDQLRARKEALIAADQEKTG